MAEQRRTQSLLGKFSTKLFVLVLLTLAPVLSLLLQRNIDQRRSEQERYVERIHTSSRLVAAAQIARVQNTRQLLSTLSGLGFLVFSTDSRSCNIHFQNLLKLSPDYANFGLIETNGTIFSAGVLPEDPATSVADRSHFQRVLRTGAFAIGGFEGGKLVREKSVTFAFPVRDQNGQLVRILFASIRLDVLAASIKDSELPGESVATILDRNGTILARFPNGHEWIGETLADAALVRKVLEVQDGVTETAGLDGIRRVYAISPIRDDTSAAMFVAVGVPTSVLFSAADRALKRNLLIAAVIIVAALLVSSLFARRVFMTPVQELSRAAMRIAEGDLTARTSENASTTEFARLASAFNKMAQSLEQREREIDSARAHIEQMNAELESRVEERTAQLSAANEELEAFSYSVSHDLRAPLRHLDGFSEMLRKTQQERLDDKGKRYVEVIGDAAKRMGTLIDELLVFSRMGRKELLKSRVHMKDIVLEAIKQLEHECSGRKIEWIVADLRQVEADAAMLRQVWINLISNAVKYTRGKDPARIEIGSLESADESIFFVRDNGVGFDMKYADKLFGVFQRLHSDKEFEGTGIGLANVRRIVLRHGGRTWAESQPGIGSTFFFSLKKHD